MTTNCSLNYELNAWKFQAQNMGRTCCVQKLFFTFRTIYVHNMFGACSFHVLNWQINEQSSVILWASWCKNKCFWKRFTCILSQIDTFDFWFTTAHYFLFVDFLVFDHFVFTIFFCCVLLKKSNFVVATNSVVVFGLDVRDVWLLLFRYTLCFLLSVIILLNVLFGSFFRNLLG